MLNSWKIENKSNIKVRDEDSRNTEAVQTRKKNVHRDEAQLVIRKIDTNLTQLKLSTKRKIKDKFKKHNKSESNGTSKNFSFPYTSPTKNETIDEEKEQKEIKEILDSSKVLKTVVRPRPRVPENIPARYAEKLTKIMKNNLSDVKQKEVLSRSTHEYCTNSPFNQLLRNFNEFVLIVNDRVDNRDDANILIESCKRINIKPIKTLFLPYYNSNEFIDEVKQKILENFLTIINDQNGSQISSSLDDNDVEKYARNNGFKAFIEKGNHGTLVKTVLNRRSWWSIKDSHDENYESWDLVWTQWLKQNIIDNLPTTDETVGIATAYNKIESNTWLSNKKNLFLNLTEYYEKAGEDYSENIPLTFLIEGGNESSSFNEFRKYYELASQSPEEDNKWICKPGENSNRGQNIIVWQDIAQIEKYVNAGIRSCYIIQKYIHNPLLINKRKFDIRCFALMTTINGKHFGYFYQDGYLRTACKEFQPDDCEDLFIHLTNDAIQKKSEDYGKFESSNKLSFLDFEKYLATHFPEDNESGVAWFYTKIYPRIKKLVRDSFLSTKDKINPNKRYNCFELYGYDFMVTDDYKVYLIEVNTNPWLETPCSLLSRIISSVLDNTFRIALDPLSFLHNSKTISLGDSTNNLSKFELIYDESQE